MQYLLYIAEDDVQLARYLEKVATSCGWTVKLCGDGLELLANLQSETSPALALIDVQMPNMNGIEVIDSLLEFKDRLRLRFMSGGPIADTLAAHMIANGRDMSVGKTIHKPMRLDELIVIFQAEKREIANIKHPG